MRKHLQKEALGNWEGFVGKRHKIIGGIVGSQWIA
jgi:hypothetical protein